MEAVFLTVITDLISFFYRLETTPSTSNLPTMSYFLNYFLMTKLLPQIVTVIFSLCSPSMVLTFHLFESISSVNNPGRICIWSSYILMYIYQFYATNMLVVVGSRRYLKVHAFVTKDSGTVYMVNLQIRASCFGFFRTPHALEIPFLFLPLLLPLVFIFRSLWTFNNIVDDKG